MRDNMAYWPLVFELMRGNDEDSAGGKNEGLSGVVLALHSRISLRARIRNRVSPRDVMPRAMLRTRSRVGGERGYFLASWRTWKARN